MPLPTTRGQIRRLGERLAAGDPVPDDLHALEELVACHLAALEIARPRLDGLAETVGTGPLHVTHRAKTTGTIIEKLRREEDMNLARMQDLAGIRIVGSFTLAEQDRLVEEITGRFPADPRDPKIVDRRAEPSHGYRAVHVIVSLDGISIEIQVRTFMQHVWADLMERLADRLGRGIRYGAPPVPPLGVSQESAQTIVTGMMGISAQWAAEAPDVPGQAALHLDVLTDQVWSNLSESLREAGIDL